MPILSLVPPPLPNPITLDHLSTLTNSVRNGEIKHLLCISIDKTNCVNRYYELAHCYYSEAMQLVGALEMFKIDLHNIYK